MGLLGRDPLVELDTESGSPGSEFCDVISGSASVAWSLGSLYLDEVNLWHGSFSGALRLVPVAMHLVSAMTACTSISCR